MSAADPAYREVIDFLAAGTTPEGPVNFRPSESVEARVADLIDRDREGALSPAEKQELADFLQLEHLMIMAKAQGRRNLALGSSHTEQLRWFVAERAGYRCGYCLIHEDDSFSRHQLDHIVSRKHGGSSGEANLAFVWPHKC